MNHDTFEALFHNFQRSAFRVEARDHYDVPAERDELVAFRHGKELPRRTPDDDPWLACVACATRSGRMIQRVRLVTLPITEYTLYESAAYLDNAAAGERIGVVERGWLRSHDQAWAGEDFWIFDDENVVTLDYDGHGRFLGAAPAGSLEPYLNAKRRAIALSVGLGHSCLRPRAEHPTTKRGVTGD